MWLGLFQASHGLDASQLLPAEKAFVPTVTVSNNQVTVEFAIADGYYLYRDKIIADTQPKKFLGQPQFTIEGKTKSDAFFGRQQVYYQRAVLSLPFLKPASGQPFSLHLSYQGCADAGICYPPVDTLLNINGDGRYQPLNLQKAIPFYNNRMNNPANLCHPQNPIATVFNYLGKH